MDFINSLHGYCIRVKEIHWNTDSNAEHVLCDEIESDIHDLEDRFAECVMGITDKKVKIGDLKPLLPHSNNLKGMLKELSDETTDIMNKIEKELGYKINIIED